MKSMTQIGVEEFGTILLAAFGGAWLLPDLFVSFSREDVMFVGITVAGYSGGAAYLLGHWRKVGISMRIRLILSVAGLLGILAAGVVNAIPVRTVVVILLCGSVASVPLLIAGFFELSSRYGSSLELIQDGRNSDSYGGVYGFVALVWSGVASMPLLNLLTGGDPVTSPMVTIGAMYIVNACAGIWSFVRGFFWFLGLGLTGTFEAFSSSEHGTRAGSDDEDHLLNEILHTDDRKRWHHDDPFEDMNAASISMTEIEWDSNDDHSASIDIDHFRHD